MHLKHPKAQGGSSGIGEAAREREKRRRKLGARGRRQEGTDETESMDAHREMYV